MVKQPFRFHLFLKVKYFEKALTDKHEADQVVKYVWPYVQSSNSGNISSFSRRSLYKGKQPLFYFHTILKRKNIISISQL